jgi:C1A family cysteine protease
MAESRTKRTARHAEIETPELALEEQPPPGAMGWLPDFPDFRDYTPHDEPVEQLLERVGVAEGLQAAPAIPAHVDLRPWFSPVENQGALGSCTANAGAGIVEYFERRAFGRHVDASRLFLYKATRDLLGWTGDTGAFLRTTMGALVLFGVPPEKYWPYVIAQYDKDPPAFCWAFAQSYQAINYYRLDPPVTPRDVLLGRIKQHLAAGLPSMFGFTVYSSIAQAGVTGKIPLPAKGEKVVGGHAIVACGYDDALQIKNTSPGGPACKGAFMIRNSWGTGWGAAGYGWLPYDYVLSGLAVDWWSLIKGEWVDTGQFG